MARRTTDNPNWGGKRPNAGRPKLVRVEKTFYTERSLRRPLTPESDLSICIAEAEVDEGDMRRGVVIGGIWHSPGEIQAIGKFYEQYRDWLETGIE